MRPRILVTRSLPEEALGPLRAVAEVEVWEEPLPPPPGVLAARAAACEGLLTLLTDRVDAGLLAQAPSLRLGGWLGGAALEVTDPGPLPPGHPLLAAPRLLVVPHVGSATATTRLRMARMAVDNLLAGLSGRPLPHTVNPEARP